MRKLLTIFAALAIVAGVSLAAPPATKAEYGTCVDTPISYGFRYGSRTVDNFGGVQAKIDVSGLADCNPPYPGFTGTHGASVWVSLSDIGHYNNIIQIGIIRCTAYLQPSWSPCSAGKAGTLRYFYAAGDGPSLGPAAIDLGPADGAEHYYKIVDNGVNRYNLYIDDVLRATASYPSWRGGINKDRARWSFERFNPHDGWGTSSTSPTSLRVAKFIDYADGTAWQDAGFGTSTVCATSGDTTHASCRIVNATKIEVWTTH